MKYKSNLIKDTTEEERRAIVEESLGNIDALCDGCAPDYISGRKELREVNMEFNARYVRGDNDRGNQGGSCVM